MAGTAYRLLPGFTGFLPLFTGLYFGHFLENRDLQIENQFRSLKHLETQP
jgi:hypothetical protein